MSNIDKRALREELSNPAIGSNAHLRKLALALLDELEAAENLAKQQGNIAVALFDEVTTLRRNADDKAPELRSQLEAAEKRIAELEAREKSLRTVGVMSQKAFQRLEGRESRFIALWPRPEIYLPRKRPEDGVIVYARVAGTAKGE